MSMGNYFSIFSENVEPAQILRFSLPGLATTLRRAFTMLLLATAVCGSAKAQYLGFVANSADNTVSVFATVTNGPTTFGGASSFQDHLIATVPVGKTPQRIAVTPGPNLNRAYVTNRDDNSLWVVDVTNVSQGTVTAQDVNPVSNPLQLNGPGGIAIANVTTGPNAGHVLAFVANLGNNSVSVIDTSNNTLFASVALGLPGLSTTLPEVASTPDGQVFVTNNSTANCSTASSNPCAGVWMINASTVTSGAVATKLPAFGSIGITASTTAATLSANVATLTLSSNPGFSVGSTIQVSGFTGADTYFNGIFTITAVNVSTLTTIQYSDTHADGKASSNGTVTEGLLPASPRGVAALIASVSGTVQTILSISDAAAPNGHVFVIDLTSGASFALTVSDSTGPSAPTALSTFCFPSASPCAATSSLNAEVIDPANDAVVLFSGTATNLLAGNVSISSLATTGTPAGLAATPDGQFSYVTGATGTFVSPYLSGKPIEVVQNFVDGPLLGNTNTSVSQGNGATGVAFSALDPNSRPVTWFLAGYPSFQGAPISQPLPVGSTVNALGESMVGVLTQQVAMSLNFDATGNTIQCTPFGGTPPAGVTGGASCQTNPSQNASLSQNGAGLIGGTSGDPNTTPPVPSFPASGVFTVAITGASNNGSSSGTAKLVVSVGANCTWSPPSSVLPNVPISATLSCTAPGKDAIKGTIDWGDGTTETMSVTALGSTPVSLKFTSHAYSAPNSYPVTVTLQDIPPGSASGPVGSVVPSPATIVVSNLILPTAPTIIAPGQSAVVPVSLAAGPNSAGVTLNTSCSVSPVGPKCSVSPLLLTLDSNGNGTVVVTVTANGSSAAVLVPRGDEWPRLPLALLIVLLALAFVFLSMCFPGNSVRKRPRWGLALLLFTSVIMLATGACTTVQRSNIGCTNCTASGSYTVMFNAQSIKPPLQISGVFTVVVTQ